MSGNKMFDYQEREVSQHLPQRRPPSQQRFSVLDQARDRLQRAIAQHRQVTTQPDSPTTARLNQALRFEGEDLSALLAKLDQTLVRIAVFGLVSRGKSALINALVGKKQLETGPINGVTQTPIAVRSARFSQTSSPTNPAASISTSRTGSAESLVPTPFIVEFIDTPGLDEIGGESRAAMAEKVATQADLILFVLAGDVTRKELQAIRRLWRFQKPLLLVFNKTDLYAAPDRRAIVKNLRQYLAEDGTDSSHSLQVNNVLQVSADPAPLQVQTQWPDGRISQAWETPAPEITALTERLSQLLQAEGTTLIALNALVQVSRIQQSIARKTLRIRREEADAIIWKFVQAKSLAIAANPIAILDLIGGSLSDLALIRALAKLYGLPMTSHEAGKLWRTILLSSGSLLVSEVGSGLLLGFGKGAAALGSLSNPLGLAAYSGTAIVQGSLAGYGSYVVGQAAQVYLEQGCTWGETGASTIINNVLAQVDKSSLLYRLRTDLEQRFPSP